MITMVAHLTYKVIQHGLKSFSITEPYVSFIKLYFAYCVFKTFGQKPILS